MSNLALELENALQHLDPQNASKLERLVRDALMLVKESSTSVPSMNESYSDVMRRLAGSFGNEPFERPSQKY